VPRPVLDFREAARRRLPRLLFDYIDGGAYDETTLRHNVADMQALSLRQRVLRDTSHVSTRTELFGQPLSMPVALAPVGFAGMFARRGEVQAARAAEAAGLPFCLSSLSICSLEEVAASCTRRIWFQLYLMRDRGLCEALLQRASAVAAPVLVLTVDLPVAGARYRDLRSGMSGPPGLSGAWMRAMQGMSHPQWLWHVQLRGGPHSFGNLPPEVTRRKGLGSFASWIAANFDPSVTWKDLEWVRARWDGPIIVKGLLDAHDAREALSCGADAIVVSNHGGRQLDGASSSIRALPAIADEVAGRIPVLIDGGIRSGLDVLRCLASGAKACLLGRAWAYALGAGGGAAVAEMLMTVHSELTVALSLTGCTDVRHASRELILN
jgi:L-lactate dehydrogenase (cytochrome)